LGAEPALREAEKSLMTIKPVHLQVLFSAVPPLCRFFFFCIKHTFCYTIRYDVGTSIPRVLAGLLWRVLAGMVGGWRWLFDLIFGGGRG